MRGVPLLRKSTLTMPASVVVPVAPSKLLTRVLECPGFRPLMFLTSCHLLRVALHL